MKKFVGCVLAILMILCVASVTARAAGMVVSCDYPSGHGTNIYADAMVVEDMKQTGEDEYFLTLKCMNGNVFGCYVPDPDWFVDDLAAVLLDDNGTPYVADDIILAIQYAGYDDPATW